MSAQHLTVSDEVDAATAKAVDEGLTHFNESHVGPDRTKALWVVCRDDHGALTGGLQAFVQWDWLFVAMLWVREDRRGLGIGTRLLAAAEEAGRTRGCTRVRLATVTFQAPDFYASRGYAEVCRLPDIPPGHDFIWMAKPLVP